MYKSVLLIVLYNTDVESSATFQSLLKYRDTLDSDTKVIVWNNGPYYIKKQCVVDLEYELINNVNNESLAKIYNLVIDEYMSERYIILDHDSSLTKEYLKEAIGVEQHNLGVPFIKCFGTAISPLVNKHPILSAETINFGKLNTFFAIGSGLVIGRELALYIKSALGTVFDERFYLYGVDSTFFYRMNSLKLNQRISLISGFNHSLSKLDDNESAKTKEFRKLERSYDLGLKVRYYREELGYFEVFKIIIWNISKLLTGKRTDFSLYNVTKAIVIGQHYRFRKEN